MSYTLDFTKIKKRTMEVIFNDGKKTTVNVMTPTKGVMDEILEIDTLLRDPEKAETVTNDMVYDLCLKILNRNTNNKKITKKYLEQVWDVDDVYMFYYSYANFVSGQANSKN